MHRNSGIYQVLFSSAEPLLPDPPNKNF